MIGLSSTGLALRSEPIFLNEASHVPIESEGNMRTNGFGLALVELITVEGAARLKVTYNNTSSQTGQMGIVLLVSDAFHSLNNKSMP